MGIEAPRAIHASRWILSRQALVFAAILISLATIYTVYSLNADDISTPQWLSLGGSGFSSTCTPGARPIDVGPSTPVYSPVEEDGRDVLEGVRVVALVFYGRRELVSILDCYLKRNLKVNGGLLDEIIFTVNTDKEDDLEYLEELLPTSPYYRKFVKSEKNEGWMGQWEAVNETDTIYIKIDDDVVFIEDDTIRTVATRLVQNPHYFAVSANVINNPALSWVHHSMGAYLPYWPDTRKVSLDAPQSWRASELPPYTGPAKGPKHFAADGSTPAPHPNHRWLPVRNPSPEYQDFSLFPAATLTFDAFGPSLHNWAAAAQTHYSFLEHLENNDTWRYKFDLWDYHYTRLSINFYAVRGADIVEVFPFPGASSDDEGYLTQTRPREVKRKVVVDGRGLAVHFAFMPQRGAHDGHGMTDTDVLERYRAYAGEMVCPFPVRGGWIGGEVARRTTGRRRARRGNM